MLSSKLAPIAVETSMLDDRFVVVLADGENCRFLRTRTTPRRRA
jgi:hypothetical protein